MPHYIRRKPAPVKTGEGLGESRHVGTGGVFQQHVKTCPYNVSVRIDEKRGSQKEVTMHVIITLEGIDEALTQLRYKSKTALKYKLLTVIRAYYEGVSSIGSIRNIDTDELVTALWETGNDPVVIKNRRKNLKSIKSTINTELKKLYHDGKNPEGIAIGPDNIFIMSDEARDNALKSLKNLVGAEDTSPLEQFRDVLNSVNDFLSTPTASFDLEENADAGTLHELKNLIRALSAKVGLDETPARRAPNTPFVEGDGINAGDRGESGSGEGKGDLRVRGSDGEVAQRDDTSESGNTSDKEDINVNDIPVEGDDDPEALIDESDDAEIVDVVDDLETADRMGVIDPEMAGGDNVTDEIETIEANEPADEMLEVIDEEDIEDIVEELAAADEVESIESPDDIDMNSGAAEVAGRMLEEEIPEEFDTTDQENPRLMAESFNHSLAAMDKYYNQYVFIPGSDYTIGISQPQWNEKPATTVHLPPFYCGKFPITNALFEIFVEKTGYTTTAEKVGHGTVYYGRRLQKLRNDQSGRLVYSGNSELIIKETKGACWYQPFGPGSTLHKKRNHPVVQVSVEDAMAFAAWTGKRLPTEDEWEAAARQAKGYIFPWGNEWIKDACNVEESLIGDTTPVDHYRESANELGIIDMLGNVMEWTITRSEYVSKEHDVSILYITKGGSFISPSSICLPRRSKLNSESHSNILGFRCIAS